MKTFDILLLVFLVFIASCSDSRKPSDVPYTHVGDPISGDEAMSGIKIDQAYSGLQVGDTLITRLEGEVESVCQMKGCWMRVRLAEEETVMVRFKDYGFFVPKDIAGSRVLVEGRAFVSEVDEQERQHIAEDAGKSDSQIAQISGSEMQKGFEATGVRIFR